MVDLNEDVVSKPVLVHDLVSGQPMRFWVHLARGGFFRCLEGRGDVRWRRDWDIDPEELATAACGTLTLQRQTSSDAVAKWLGIDVPPNPGMVVGRPATTAAIGALQQREALGLPPQVRELLEIADGLLVGGWAILGVRDLCVVEIEGGQHWQVAVGAGPGDDRRCLTQISQRGGRGWPDGVVGCSGGR